MNDRNWNGTSTAVSLHSVFTEYTCIQGEVFCLFSLSILGYKLTFFTSWKRELHVF